MYTHTHTHMPERRTYINIHAYIFKYIYIYTYALIYTHIFTHTHDAHASIHLRIANDIHTCIYTYIYIYICINLHTYYTHTHTHTRIPLGNASRIIAIEQVKSFAQLCLTGRVQFDFRKAVDGHFPHGPDGCMCVRDI